MPVDGFSQSAFDEDFEAAASTCSVLSREQARRFVEQGYVVVNGAFPRDLADSVCGQAWLELADKHDVRQGDPASWNKSFSGGMPGYVRTAGSGARFLLADDAPRALMAQADVIGGVNRMPGRGAKLAWSDVAIGNLGIREFSAWQPPHPQQQGWHKDGWHFRHFLNSPEQGLLTVPLFSDILPRSGGTFIAPGSIRPVAQLLAAHPQGLHADSVQGAGYLIPGLIEQCSRFEELTGEVGDMVLIHPYMLHRVAKNPSDRPRFIANHALMLQQPMTFSRNPQQPFSLVELAVLKALGVNDLDLVNTRSMEAVVPAPFRTEAQADKQRQLLHQEMKNMADSGVITPPWAVRQGYMSNREEAG